MTKSNHCIRVGVFSDILTEIPSFSSLTLLNALVLTPFHYRSFLVSSELVLSLSFVADFLRRSLFLLYTIYKYIYGALTRI